MQSLKVCENKCSLFPKRMNKFHQKLCSKFQIFGKSIHQISNLLDIFYQSLFQHAAQKNQHENFISFPSPIYLNFNKYTVYFFLTAYHKINNMLLLNKFNFKKKVDYRKAQIF